MTTIPGPQYFEDYLNTNEIIPNTDTSYRDFRLALICFAHPELKQEIMRIQEECRKLNAPVTKANAEIAKYLYANAHLFVTKPANSQ